MAKSLNPTGHGDYAKALGKARDMFVEWCVRYEIRRRQHNEKIQATGDDFQDSALMQAIVRHATLIEILQDSFGLSSEDTERIYNRVYAAIDEHLKLDRKEAALTKLFGGASTRGTNEWDCCRALYDMGMLKELPFPMSPEQEE